MRTPDFSSGFPGRLRYWGLLAVCLAAGMLAPVVRGQVVLRRIAPIPTTGGLLAGEVLPSGVKAWLGIPYARPPVDELRWRPPQPMHWRGVWDADRKMPECIQVLRPHDINNYFGEEATSEDCLYMNVWAPPGAHPGSKLPVIAFIYGGGFSIGSSGMTLYDGEQVAKHGAVFVNFNYRLGILGFMAHPELTREQGGHSGDYAFLDQNAALKWIRDNISNFGGDPAKVLLMGQSAGAGSVTAQVFSPLSRGLFSEAVMSSGCSWASSGFMGPEPTLSQAEQVGLQIQKLLHVSSLEAMRQLPADRILAVQAEFQVGANRAGVRTGPIIDGYFTPASQLDILKAHENSDVPIIASSNGDDLDANMSPLTKATTVAQYKKIARKMYGSNAAAFLALYPASSDSEVSAVAHRAAEDGGLQGAARHCAQLQSQYDKSPAYIDLFTLKNPYIPGVRIADQDPATIGAYHVADLAYWFGTLNTYNMFRSTRAWRPWDLELSKDMMETLIAFARSGSPATAAVKWPAWSAADERRVVFGKRITVEKLDTKGMDWLAVHPAVKLPLPPPRPGAKPFY
jgi:para-nitrobenzyl esterase